MPDSERCAGESASLASLRLRVCGCSAVIKCQQPAIAQLVRKIFAPLAVPDGSSAKAKPRSSSSGTENSGEEIQIGAGGEGTAVGAVLELEDTLFAVDKALTIALQLRRPDLLFVHAAVVSWQGQAVALAAPSGTGKSTATLALLADGFDYLSDELAPIDLASLDVHPYPRALCLKAEPPAPYQLPVDVLRVGSKIHVPAESLAAKVATQPARLAAFFFLSRERCGDRASVRSLSVAAGATHLVANALNPLAHSSRGVDAAIGLAERTPCFELNTADLTVVAAAIRSAISGVRE